MMTNKENEALILAKEYKNQLRSIFGSFTNTDKWHKYFLNTVLLFADNPDWNAREFIRTNFEQRGKIFPTQLPNKYSWQIYLRRNLL